jgi:outer membrane protein assembly factor BamB
MADAATRLSPPRPPRARPRRPSRSGAGLLAALVAAFALPAAVPRAARAADWLQFNYDSRHSGANPEETVLGPGNVGGLRVLYHVALPGVADGAPVFLSGVATPLGTKDLLFLTTRRGILLALDAASGAVVWSRRPARRPGFTTAMPAIDPGRRFVYAYGLDGSVHRYRVEDGAEVAGRGWPQPATVKPASEQGSADLTVAVAASGRAYLYAASTGYPGAAGDSQGHVTAIDLSRGASGAQRVFNAVCSDQAGHFPAGGAADCSRTQAGIWARAGVVYDPELDRIFFTTGVGVFDADHGGRDWGDTVLALHPDGSGAGGGLPVDAYTPNDFQQLQDAGADLGSSHPVLLPPAAGSKYPHLVVQAGREGELHLLDRDDLSRQGGPGHIAGEVEPVAVPQGGPVETAPAVWVNPHDGTTWIFFVNDNGISAMQLFVDAAGNPTIFPQWTKSGGGGSSPVLAHGVLFYAGTAGLQALDPASGAVLYAHPGPGPIHWESPIVVNGRVYLADESGTLWAFGLRRRHAPPGPG